MAHVFTFKEETTSTSSTKEKTKTDNIGGVLYEAVRKSKVRNPRFKIEFVASIPRTKNYSNSAHALLTMYRNTGSLKCDCCGSDNVYFTMHKENGRVTFKPFVDTDQHGTQPLTLDHNLLKSLGGENQIHNYTPLCRRCNSIRGSRFAEYKEFKEWYNTQDCIDTIAGMPSANFCYIDYDLNFNNSHIENIKNSSVLPPARVLTMKKQMRKQVYSVFTHLKIKEWLSLDRTYANKLLNELVYERSYYCENVRVPMGNHDFFSGCNNPDHRKLMLHIEQQVSAQLRKRRNKHKEMIMSAREMKTEIEPVEVQKQRFSIKSLFEKISKIFA